MTYEVGQELWYVAHDARRGRIDGATPGHTVTVLRVGRVWADLSHKMRVRIGQTWVDGGRYSSPGRVYASRETYLEASDVAAEWNRFVMDIRNHIGGPKPGMTVERIRGVRRLLGMEREGK